MIIEGLLSKKRFACPRIILQLPKRNESKPRENLLTLRFREKNNRITRFVWTAVNILVYYFGYNPFLEWQVFIYQRNNKFQQIAFSEGITQLLLNRIVANAKYFSDVGNKFFNLS